MLATQIVMEKITDTKKSLGNASNKKAYIDQGVFTISTNDLEEIHNEIRLRDALGFIEDPDEEKFHEDNGDDSDDESNC